MTQAVPDGSFLGQHAPQATEIAHLFTRTLVICGVIFGVVVVLVGFCVVHFRARGEGEPAQIEGNRALEIGWTLVPLAVLGWLLVLTSRAMAIADPSVDRAPDLTVIAHQWWWEVRYPSGAVTANEIHVPTGKALVVRIESGDVVHDFWVPSLGRKVDAIPGRPVNVWLQSDRAGTFLGTCAEFCGMQHAWMRIRVIAQSSADFATWERHQATPAGLPPTTNGASRGLALFRSRTCITCHAVRGIDEARIAPDLTHLAERSTLAAGVILNTPVELTRWLKDPQRIKPGCNMPNAQLSDPEIADLVSYFETLQ